MPASILRVLTVLAFVLPIALYFWLISADAIDMLRADQWYDIRLIQHSFTGTLRFGMLWSQHGDNRIFVQNIITLILGHVIHYNVIVEEYISAVLLIAATTLVILTHQRRAPQDALDCLLPRGGRPALRCPIWRYLVRIPDRLVPHHVGPLDRSLLSRPSRSDANRLLRRSGCCDRGELLVPTRAIHLAGRTRASPSTSTIQIVRAQLDRGGSCVGGPLFPQLEWCGERWNLIPTTASGRGCEFLLFRRWRRGQHSNPGCSPWCPIRCLRSGNSDCWDRCVAASCIWLSGRRVECAPSRRGVDLVWAAVCRRHSGRPHFIWAERCKHFPLRDV